MHKLLLTNTQVSRLSEGSANGLSANPNLPKIQLFKMAQLGGFLHRLWEVLLEMVAWSSSGADAGIHKKLLGFWTARLVFRYEELDDIIKTLSPQKR